MSNRCTAGHTHTTPDLWPSFVGQIQGGLEWRTKRMGRWPYLSLVNPRLMSLRDFPFLRSRGELGHPSSVIPQLDVKLEVNLFESSLWTFLDQLSSNSLCSVLSQGDIRLPGAQSDQLPYRPAASNSTGDKSFKMEAMRPCSLPLIVLCCSLRATFEVSLL